MNLTPLAGCAISQARTQGLNAWAKDIGINKESLRTRLERGWSVERALTTGATR